ncbi:hypothetical protein BDZ94DRAFT_1249698 [Collybia nuda]|uniref:Uncharacterized protein n=1 Tax=Collybia nuda TaxID=64659 RepID=A0A9P6CIB3_9AGAR|nr:hypothetical protein BDZ94DRAFT_1249698 [Collybia nuda]
MALLQGGFFYVFEHGTLTKRYFHPLCWFIYGSSQLPSIILLLLARPPIFHGTAQF